jgi:RNA polymerase sigma-70 factor, ECF subfamily
VTSETGPAHNRPASVREMEGPPATAPSDVGADPAMARSAARPGLSREQLEQVRRRDPEALGALFERYFDQVYGIAYRLLGERAAAQDLTQEVFLKVHRAAAQLDANRDPGPWLTAITYNACRDVWRSGAYRMSRRSASLDYVPVTAAALVSSDATPEAAQITAERERLVQEAIAKLPESLRAAIVLYDYQGLSHQQVAEATGIHHAAARKRYSRALQALGELLGDTLRP